ncbi:MAG: RdgB/HAM1 family non-canonical purine NTP pyrophosphatase [Cephaloticoccus sp.]|nr:RdgB/HAM1 family non-canonical purine NTP pyrophosphatase [Cephaloticoccus sp.]MCF7759941.1 RdgB/HAM1 family non-canonical purine NTP pyrophosphatase [Cephaloticoccus sp.]
MKLYLASGNAHKVQELQALAVATMPDARIFSAREVGGMPPVVEDTGTFTGNARKKAHALWELLPHDGWALADDSGICVDALHGAPGVESAYYAGSNSNDGANLAKLVEVMRDVPSGSRGAHYVCVLVLISPEGKEHGFEGKCHGNLLLEPIGIGGFGYDPLFVPSGHDCTFGQLPAATKQQLSHRAQAWSQLVRWRLLHNGV